MLSKFSNKAWGCTHSWSGKILVGSSPKWIPKNLRIMASFWGRVRDGRFHGGPPWGVDFVTGVGIPKTNKSPNHSLKPGYMNYVHFPQSKEMWQTRAKTLPKDTKRQVLKKQKKICIIEPFHRNYSEQFRPTFWSWRIDSYLEKS